ncbi:MAG: rhodanese-like domain-containing protein [Solirubrobacteraceae bacterium]
MSGGELAARLRDEDLLVCDCRFAGNAESSRAGYLDGHILGAIHVYWLEDLSTADTTVTTFLPTPDEAADMLSRLGITHEKTVVAYSDGGNLYASRLWHVLAHYGHEQAALLDGGIEKWQAEGRPLERGAVTPAPARFEPRASRWLRGVGARRSSGGLMTLRSGWSTCAARPSSQASSCAPPAAAISRARSCGRGRRTCGRTAPCATLSRFEPRRGRRSVA